MTDIIKLLGIATEILKTTTQFGLDWKDAPADTRSFINELQVLKTVLSETNTNIVLNPDFAEAFKEGTSSLLSQLSPASPPTCTQQLVSTCSEELQNLLETLKKRSEGRPIGWERAKGAFNAKRTREAVQNLFRQCQSLNSLMTVDALTLGAKIHAQVQEARNEQRAWNEKISEVENQVQKDVETLAIRDTLRESKEFRQRLLNSLSTIDYTAQQNDILKRREPGTGQWLLESAEYCNWLQASRQPDKQILFCPGIPGAGKTVISSIVIENLHQKFHTEPGIGLAYLFFNFRRQEEQTIENLLLNLLRQLAESQTSLPEAAVALFKKREEGTDKHISSEEASRALLATISSFSRVYLVVDALDECQTAQKCRARFIKELFGLREKCPGVQILATSRFIPEICDHFSDSASIKIRAEQSDVRKYLEARMDELPGFVQRNEILQEEIISTIIKAVSGMFLLAFIYLGSLDDKTTPKLMKLALNQLREQAKGADKASLLGPAYEQAMERINGQKRGLRDLALQALAWITFAKRPLNTVELQHALAIEEGETELDDANLPEVDDILSVCAGLVTVDEDSNIIRLVHYTTQEYFEQTHARWFPDAELNLSTYCLTYLSFQPFSNGPCEMRGDLKKRVLANPLYRYAAAHWGDHVRESHRLSTLAVPFCTNEALLRSAWQATPDNFDKIKRKWGESAKLKYANLTPMHIAAYFGATELVRSLIALGYEVHFKYNEDPSPLYYASSQGHSETVDLLLGAGADIEGGRKFYPLEAAVQNGHQMVVEILLQKGADVEANCPLSEAAQFGHAEIVKLLLKHGANAAAYNFVGKTALMQAVFSGQKQIVESVLEAGVDINQRSQIGATALHEAVWRDGGEIVRLLIRNGAELDPINEDGVTPLILASCYGNLDVVRILLDEGANIEAGWTALSYATALGYLDIVEMLLQHGADPRGRDHYGNSIVSLAVRNGRKEVVDMLLEHDSQLDLRSTDIFGRSALWYAVRYGFAEIEKALCQYSKSDGPEQLLVEVNPQQVTPRQITRRLYHRACNACALAIDFGATCHKCKICLQGELLLCSECISGGAKCPGGHEELKEYTIDEEFSDRWEEKDDSLYDWEYSEDDAEEDNTNRRIRN